MQTPAEILAVIAPDLATLEGAAGAIDVADMQVGDCSKRNLLVAYLAAHTLTLSLRGASGAAGSATSLSEGGLSAGFSGSGLTGSYGQTSYGVEYERLSRGCVFAPRTRVKI